MKPTLLTPLLLLLTPISATHQDALKLSIPPSMAATDTPTGPPLLGDILPLDKQISIFSGFTRSVESISVLLSDRGENTTVLAPSNAAVSRLPRKPWEDPDDAEGAADYSGIQGEDRASRNLRRFVEAHCVVAAPWEEGVKARTVEGVEVWWEMGGNGRRRVMPDGIEVLQAKEEVANGQLWVLDGGFSGSRC